MWVVYVIITLLCLVLIYDSWNSSKKIRQAFEEEMEDFREIIDLIKDYITYKDQSYWVIGFIESTDLFQWGPYPSPQAASAAAVFISKNTENIIGYNATTKTIEQVPVFKQELEFRIDSYPLGVENKVP